MDRSLSCAPLSFFDNYQALSNTGKATLLKMLPQHRFSPTSDQYWCCSRKQQMTVPASIYYEINRALTENPAYNLKSCMDWLENRLYFTNIRIYKFRNQYPDPLLHVHTALHAKAYYIIYVYIYSEFNTQIHFYNGSPLLTFAWSISCQSLLHP